MYGLVESGHLGCGEHAGSRDDLMGFDEADWIKRLGAAVEAVAADAKPNCRPLAGVILRAPCTVDDYYSALRREYRALAVRAKDDPTARRQFQESNLWVDDTGEAKAILKEHPFLRRGLEGQEREEWVGFNVVNNWFSGDLTGIVSCLAKLSFKEGGPESARRLHKYMTLGGNHSIPAHEITVFYGLIVSRRIELGHGAFLAPYAVARAQLNLPDEPEPLRESPPNPAVLVRGLRYGPGVAPPPEHSGNLDALRLSYDFPAGYRNDLGGWWADRRMLVDLFSIAARTPLLSRTRYVRLASWIEEINPNFGFGTQESRGFVSDVPPKSRDLTMGDVDAFVALAHDWYEQPRKRDPMILAIRRLAGAFSRPGGRFGVEDRILDVAIALEVLYDGKTGHRLAKRAAALLEAGVEEQIRTYDEALTFYRLRSSIVHGEEPVPGNEAVHKGLVAGRELARRTLAARIREPVPWDEVMKQLQPKAQAYIEAKSPGGGC